MFTVTDPAAEYLKRALVGVEEPADACFRIRVGANGPQLAIDRLQPDDSKVESDGEVLLAVDPDTGEQLEDYALDFDNEKSRLTLVKS